MKLMIASDIHGSAFYCKQLIEAYKQEQPDKLLLLGDLLYHGPRNDLPKDYAPKQVIEMLNAISDQLICVRGNCEAEVDQMVLNFPVLSESCILYIDGQTIYATHGHINSPANPPKLHKGDILLTGHTHIPAWEEYDLSLIHIYGLQHRSLRSNQIHKLHLIILILYSLDHNDL